MKVQHLNKGRIDTILNCPWKYWRTYDYDGDSKPIIGGYSAANLGTACHDALEKLYEDKGLKGNKADLLKIYDEINDNSPLKADDYADGREILSNWFEKVYLNYQTEETRRFIGAEVQFGYSPRHDEGTEMLVGGVPIHGYIDRVDEIITEDGKRIIEVVDYKSNRSPKPRVEIDDTQNAEVNIYLMAARKLYPDADEYVFVYDFLRWGLFKTSRTKETLIDYLRFMKRVHNYAVNLDKPEQKLGSACGWCDYHDECEKIKEAKNNDVASQVLGKGASMGALAKEHAAVSALASALYRRKAKLESEMKANLTRNDMLSYTDDEVQLTLRAKKQDSYNTQIVIDELSEHAPEDLAKAVSVSKGKLDKMLKSLPAETRDKLIRSMKRGYQNPSLHIMLRKDTD